MPSSEKKSGECFINKTSFGQQDAKHFKIEEVKKVNTAVISSRMCQQKFRGSHPKQKHKKEQEQKEVKEFDNKYSSIVLICKKVENKSFIK